MRLKTRLSFGSAGLAEGVIDNGLTYFVLIYYSQVLGLSATLASFAVAVGLVVDAVSDPLVGWWSDHFRSRLGRRHPFVYASIVPLSLTYYLIWVPPESLSEMSLFAYLALMCVCLRLSRTFFSIPMFALVPELTSDYDERTSIMNSWMSSLWFWGTVMTAAMYGHWLADSPEYPDGILRSAGYVEAGLVGGLMVLFGTTAAALGTHSEIPNLKKSDLPAVSGVREVFSQLRETLADRSILSLVTAAILNGTASGAINVLWVYLMSYYWELESWHMSWMMFSQIASPLIGYAITPLLANRHDKRSVQIWISLVSIVAYSAPFALRAMDLFPDNGHPFVFPFLLVNGVLGGVLGVISWTINASMLMDIVEAREVETGRREEGVLAAMQAFVRKASMALGTLVGGLALDFIAFPVQTAVGEVPEEAIARLGLLYGPILAILYFAAIAMLYFYRIDRHTHLRNIAQLESRASASQEPS